MAYLYLAVAIVAEVVGTTLFRMSQGFERWGFGLLGLCAYGVALVLLGLAMKVIPMSVSYTLWASIGTALTVVVGLLYFGERMTSGQWLGLVLVVGGALLLKLAGPAGP